MSSNHLHRVFEEAAPFQTFPMGCFVGAVVHSVSLVYIVVNIAFIYISYLLSVHV